MSDRGVTFDLGYQPHDGPRLGTRAAVRATFLDGVRRVLGLRRKARKKIFPWLLIAISVLPAVVFVGLAFLLDQFEIEGDSPFGGHAEFFGLIGNLVLIFAALAGPQLLIPDREEGVLSIYSSRPMRAWDYLGARAGALAAVLATLLLIPQLLMYIGFAALDDVGLWQGLIDRADDLWRIMAATAVYVVGYGAPALLVATFLRRTGVAAAVYIGVMIVASFVAAVLVEQGAAGSDLAALLAIPEHPPVVMDWIFSRDSIDLTPITAGWDPWVSLLVIIGVALATAFLASRKYRSYM